MSSTTIQAVPDNSQLSSAGSQAGCDHYRNGYLGLAMCVNFYEDTANDKAYVQVVGSMTNVGQVDICNLTISISSLETATYKNPAWLPNYPKTQSFKSGTYFPFTAILPMNAGSSASYRYPTVDVKMGFYACDAALKALPEDKIVPPPGTRQSSVEAGDDLPESNPAAASGFGSKIMWSDLNTAIGAQSKCLITCLGNLNEQGDDCAAAAYVLHSGCLQKCPEAVLRWTINACTKAKCHSDQCALQTTSAGPCRSSAAYLSSVMLGAVLYGGLWALG
ncbi:Hypothetical protein NocV09_00103330 [Nannochloropsis oceanica]